MWLSGQLSSSPVMSKLGFGLSAFRCVQSGMHDNVVLIRLVRFGIKNLSIAF